MKLPDFSDEDLMITIGLSLVILVLLGDVIVWLFFFKR